MKPLSDRLIVQPTAIERKTTSGIIIPDTVQEKPQKGEVILVGPGKVADSGRLVPMNVKQGDTVLFSKHAGVEIEVDGKTMLIMRESDIFAVV